MRVGDRVRERSERENRVRVGDRVRERSEREKQSESGRQSEREE